MCVFVFLCVCLCLCICFSISYIRLFVPTTLEKERDLRETLFIYPTVVHWFVHYTIALIVERPTATSTAAVVKLVDDDDDDDADEDDEDDVFSSRWVAGSANSNNDSIVIIMAIVFVALAINEFVYRCTSCCGCSFFPLPLPPSSLYLMYGNDKSWCEEICYRINNSILYSNKPITTRIGIDVDVYLDVDMDEDADEDVDVMGMWMWWM